MQGLMRLFKSDEERESYVSTMNDPFNKKSVQNIFMWVRKYWHGKVEFSAKVEFKNNMTEGAHNIKADDFPSLCKAIESFLTNLTE